MSTRLQIDIKHPDLIKAFYRAQEADPNITKREFGEHLMLEGIKAVSAPSTAAAVPAAGDPPLMAPTIQECEAYIKQKGYKPMNRAWSVVMNLRDACEKWKQIVDRRYAPEAKSVAIR